MVKNSYRITLCSLFIIITSTSLFGQMKVDLPDRNGLLWEITGNGLNKPSYVYGTMHVSSKLAFHLGDSFYYALQNSDMVALEQNLDTVIDDWVMERDRNRYNGANNYFPTISLGTFDINKIDKKDINRAISYDPYVLNSIMFRTNESNEDFQQETYLDLYIYRLGKKMGKIIGGVEDYKEADALVKKASKGAREDYKNRKKNGTENDNYYQFRNFDFDDAYRKGNLKLIDSFERSTNGPQFLEYMLFVRNENMVRRMDSIMKLGVSLFTGVGCAHLGAERGVLNLLVQQGYTIRPVQSMSNRISDISKKYDDIKYPLVYKNRISPDSSFMAEIPGEWITAYSSSDFQINIYPELVNGYFYTVYKLKTNGTIFGEKPEDILLKVDTSLFESVPGKIIDQKDIVIGGHRGYEIINKTTEGDFQRYYIIVKPLEVYIFKLGGKEEYAKSKDADKFFKSIQFTSQKSNDFARYRTVDSTLSFNFPSHATKSKIVNYDNKQNATFALTAFDENSNTTYLVEQLRANRNLDEDTFDLKVLMESLSNTDDFVLEEYKLDKYKGYDRITAAMSGDKERNLKSEIYIVDDKVILLAAISKGSLMPNKEFFNSIDIAEANYSKFEEYYDEKAKYTVKTPTIPLEDLENEDEDDEDDFGYGYYSEDEDKGDSTAGQYVSKTFAAQDGAEVIKVRFYTKNRYSKLDSLRNLEISVLREENPFYVIEDTLFRVSGNKTIVDAVIGDTATPMVTFTRNIYSQGGFYEIYGAYNKEKGKSKFISTFLETFTITDTLWSSNPFVSSFDTFYHDYFTKDSMNRERLIKKITGWRNSVDIEDSDAPLLIQFIKSFYIEKDYVKRKADLVEELGKLKHKSVYPALVSFYKDFGDTTNLKMSVLMAMSRQKNKASYAFINDKLINDLPIGASDLDNLFNYRLDDSLKLTKAMFPSMLDLTIVDEIEQQPYKLLGRLLDSGFIKPSVYKKYLKSIYLDGFYSFKRKLVKEETKDNEALGLIGGKNKDEWGRSRSRYSSSRGGSYGSNYLSIARLLIPFKDKNTKYKQLFADMHKLKDVDDRFDLLKFCIKYDLDYPDTMIAYYSNLKKYRLKMYDYLLDVNKVDLFPAQFYAHDSIIYAKLQGKYNTYYNKVDSLVVVESFTYTQDGKDVDGRMYKMYRKASENPELVMVTNIPTDSIGGIYTYSIRMQGEVKPEQNEAAVIAASIRQYKLMADKPNSYYYRNYYYSDYDSEEVGYDF